jgi:predicted enzyme related to lactoylglutathione lyase
MPERTAYEPGTPSWVDLATPDIAAAKRFYTELFGWEAQDAGSQEETGGYAFFLLGGKRVAGVMPIRGEGQPPAWSTYVSTDDADGVAKRALAAGATILAAPMDVMEAGRMAFFSHPAAGFIGCWQPGQHPGADVVNEPGTLTWNELHTRDLGGARAFGESVFGWSGDEQDFGGFPYVVLQVGKAPVGGMTGMPPGVPDEVPAFWLTYFAVDDCDASVERVRELGGSVTAEPMEVENVGRFAVVGDPHGAQFAVIRNAPAR